MLGAGKEIYQLSYLKHDLAVRAEEDENKKGQNSRMESLFTLLVCETYDNKAMTTKQESFGASLVWL